MATWILLAVLAAIALWLITTYNGLVSLKNKTDEAWSDIDVQLKRRYDLVPNLVETVKGYASHEQGTFQKVIEARNAAMGAKGVAEHAQAENILSQTLKSMFALAESYPDLKANQGFLELQGQLAELEGHLQAARRFYNGNVRDFNTKLQEFPTNLIGGTLGFAPRDFFEITETEKVTPTVQFSNK